MKGDAKGITTFDELMERKYGGIGTPERDAFEEKARAFVLSELLKDGRLQAKITQEQLADRIGTNKSYISKLESGKSDIQLSTLYRIFEKGLGKTVHLSIS